MMQPIEIFVDGKPIAQPRHRHATSRSGKTHSYTPNIPGLAFWKNMIALTCRSHRSPSGPYEGPVELGLNFYLPRPQRLMRKGNPDGPLPHIVKPDLDNLVKAVKDVITLSGLWKDDCQVWRYIEQPSKEYCGKNGATGVKITIKFT